ncbi:MAG: hypothetical protein HUU08_10630 [Candidatus Brocadia sp.]|nr:hypothetical protein [Candidatus Brocadia sp.]
MRQLTFLFGFIVSQILFLIHALATDYSSMTPIEGTDNVYLVVSDLKYPRDKGPRIGILTVTDEAGAVYSPVTVNDWLDSTGKETEPNDLEACCAIPGRPNEYLLAESGYHENKYGRIFRMLLTKDNTNGFKAKVLSSFKIYNSELDEKGSSYPCNQVEGIACFQAFGKIIFVYSERGGKGKKDVPKLSKLLWGEINFTVSPPAFKKLGEDNLVTKSILNDRDSTDLFLKSEGGRIDIYSVATTDPGNIGPFKSVFYKAGSFVLGTEKEGIHFEREPGPKVIYSMDGLKVEAIATTTVAKSLFCIGTDDEYFGGIWRPLSVYLK